MNKKIIILIVIYASLLFSVLIVALSHMMSPILSIFDRLFGYPTPSDIYLKKQAVFYFLAALPPLLGGIFSYFIFRSKE